MKTRRWPTMDWRRSIEMARGDSKFVSEVVRLFDLKYDTRDISKILHDKESAVEAALHLGLEIRRGEAGLATND